MADYDWVLFTPQASAPATPAKLEVYYLNSDDHLYICIDGTGAGGGACSDLRFVPSASPPAAAEGKVYYDTDDSFYLCTAV